MPAMHSMRRLLLLALLCLALVDSSLSAPTAGDYELGPDSHAQEGVPRGEVRKYSFTNSTIYPGTVRDYWVYVPAQYNAGLPAAVMIFQDGGSYVNVNSNGQYRVPIVFDNLIAKKEMPVTIGIFITPGAKGVEDYDYLKSRDANNRSFEYDSLGDRYARFLMDEMLPEISKKYNLTKDPEGRAIGGTSSGAICAFNVAWERPDQFRKVISCIGSYTDIRGGHVFPKLVRENQKKPVRIFLEDTLHDNPRPDNPNRDWHVQNVAMLAALTEKGYDVKHSFAEGTHSDSHGGSIMPEMLRWIWRDYPK
jgi:enterochelin esterase family protein